MSDRRVRVRIYLKGGAVVEFTATSISVSKHRTENSVTALEWKDAIPDPFYVCLDEIAGVFVEDV